MDKEVFVKGNIFVCRNFQYKELQPFAEEKDREGIDEFISGDLYIDKNHTGDSPETIYYATGEILPFCVFENSGQIYDSPELIYMKFQAEIKKLEKLLNIVHLENESEQFLFIQLWIGTTDLLGAFLAELFEFLINENKKYFQNYIRNSSRFKNQKIPLSDIYDISRNLRNEVKKEIQQTGCHCLGTFKEMYENAFEIKFPPLGELTKEFLIRHTILHPDYRTPKEKQLNFSKKDLYRLKEEIFSFMSQLAKKLNLRIV